MLGWCICIAIACLILQGGVNGSRSIISTDSHSMACPVFMVWSATPDETLLSNRFFGVPGPWYLIASLNVQCMFDHNHYMGSGRLPHKFLMVRPDL